MNNQIYKVKIYYVAPIKEWKWQFIAPNGKAVCRSISGYESRGEARRGAKRFLKAVRVKKVEFEEECRDNPASIHHLMPVVNI